MKKYFITWNCGYGESQEVVETDNLEKAQEIAYEMCLEEAENNMDFNVCLLTSDIIEEYSLEEEE